jgi:GNAT superfamily N-acetyltransferase
MLLGAIILNTTIRELRQEDQAEVLALIETIPQWFNNDARERAIPIDIQHHHGYVAEADGLIVGFITLFVFEGRLIIGWLGVIATHHRLGVGGRLLQQAEQYGRECGIKELATYTLGDSVDYEPYEATRQFYYRHGFTIYQRNQTDNPGCPEEIWIKKPIQ